MVKFHSSLWAASGIAKVEVGAAVIGVSSCKPNCARAPCRQLHWLLSCDAEAKWKCSGKKKTNSNSAAQVRGLTIFAVLTPETSMGVNLIKGVYLVNLKRSQTGAVVLPESRKRHRPTRGLDPVAAFQRIQILR